VLLDQYQEEYERQKQLYGKNLTSEQIYKDSYYAYKSQEANYLALMEQKKAASSRLEKAKDNLNKTTIKAPMEGTITLTDVEVGEIAQAQTSFTQGRTLMVLSDLSAFEVEVEIDETDIADLDLGQEAKIEIDAFPDTVFQGQVAEIGNTALTTGYGTSDQATNFRVKVSLSDANPKIRPGMSSTVDITTNHHPDVVTVPIQAVVMRSFDPDSLPKIDPKSQEAESGNVAMASPIAEADSTTKNDSGEEEKIEKKGVFVVRDGVAHFAEITTGIADQQNFEVLEGLKEGDEVITGNFRTLRTIKDGTPVKIDNWQNKKDISE
jgi:HlyD family secretion protein